MLITMAFVATAGSGTDVVSPNRMVIVHEEPLGAEPLMVIYKPSVDKLTLVLSDMSQHHFRNRDFGGVGHSKVICAVVLQRSDGPDATTAYGTVSNVVNEE